LSAILASRVDKQDELLQTLEALRGRIAGTDGCLECVVSRDVSGQPRFILFMVWKDSRSLDGFLSSDDFRILRGAMGVLSSPGELRYVATETTPGFSS
jgi:quinol monooxygenase YgiN